MITQSINLNLIPGGVLPRINVSQYDKGSRTLVFNLYNGSTAFIIPGNSTITIQGTKADKTGFQYECTYSGSVVTADLEQQMTVFAGDVICELVITNSGNILGSANFVLSVEEAALADDVIISETELPLIEKASQAAEYAQDAEAYAAGTRDGVPVSPGDEAYHNNAKYYADNFNKILAPVETDPSASSKAYAVGQHFILDGELYKAKTPIAPGDALVLDTNYEAAESIEAQIETLDAENEALTNNLADEVSARAMLGVHNLYSGEDVEKTVIDTAYTIVELPTKAGSYIFSALITSTNVTTNKVRVSFRKSDGSEVSTIFLTANSGERVSAELNLSSDAGKIYFYGGENTSSGDFQYTSTYTDIMIVLSTDANTSYQPYAMTNRELTESVNNLKMKYIVKQITLAANNSTTLDLSGDFALPSGSRIQSLQLALSAYDTINSQPIPLPYCDPSTGDVKTWLERFSPNGSNVKIDNLTGVWTDYYLHAVAFYT